MARCNLCADISIPGLYKPYGPCNTNNRELCVACLNIKKLESQIAKAKMDMDKLFEQHRELRTQMNRAHDPIIHCVPPEIATCIFQYFVASGQSPLVLGAVCRAWRHIAWSTPSLWTTIEINAEQHTIASSRDIAKEWLDRSGSLPLSISFRAPSTLDWYRKRKNEDGLLDLIGVINQHSPRWLMLDVELFGGFFQHLGDHTRPVANLRTLRLKSAGHSFPPPEFCISDGKPRPENVLLASFNLRDVHIEWDDVTYAELLMFQVDDILEVLKSAPELRTCILLISSVSRLEEHFPIPSSPVIHTQITDITCKFYHLANYPNSLDTFFEKTSFPNLLRFAWVPRKSDKGYYFPELPARSMKSFFRRSSCLLQELIIVEARLIDDEIIPILRELPSLRILELCPAYRSPYVPYNLFEIIAKTSMSHSSNFLPKLQCLRYAHLSPEIKFEWKDVPDLFGPLPELGSPVLRPLKTVQIRVLKKENPSFSFIDENSLNNMLEILKKGLELDVSDRDSGSDIIQASLKHHESIARSNSRRRSKR